MRNYILNTSIGIDIQEISNRLKDHGIDKIRIIPVIGQTYEIAGLKLRCVEHKKGMAKLKTNEITLNLLEVNV